MKQANKIIIFIVLLSLITSLVSAIDSGYAFMPEDRPFVFSLSFLTATGISRGCSDYPDSTGVVYTGSKSLTGCGGYKDLYNIYEITATGSWKFISEKTAPTTYSSSNNWAWECYSCSQPMASCIENVKTCISDSQISKCVNGQDIFYTVCSSTSQCKNGRCVASSCIERWTCSGWTECIGNLFYRDCRDTNNCGTTKDKPISKFTCQTEDVPPVAGQLDNPPRERDNTWIYFSIMGVFLFVILIVIFIKRKK